MRFRKQPRGSIMSLAIVVSVVLTSLVLAMAFCAGEATQRTSALSNADQAYYAAEAGAQRVVWYCKNHQLASITSPLTGTVNGFTYSTSWSTVSGSTIHINSTAYLNTVSYSLSEDVTPAAPAMGTIASVGDFDNKNFDITGDVSTAGNYVNTNKGTITGNLTYGGSASDTGYVTGTVTKGAFNTINFTALETSLTSTATTKTTTDVYDFTVLSGTNKVIYVNGNVTNPTIIGAGTLYVNGTILYTGNGTIGASSAPVNLVATGDVTFNKNMTLYGGLYTPANWTRSQISGQAVIYIGQQIDKSNSGNSSMTMGAVPWFDPRASGGNSSTTVTKFSGPQP